MENISIKAAHTPREANMVKDINIKNNAGVILWLKTKT